MASQTLTALYDTYVEARDTVIELEMAGIASGAIRLTAPHGANSYAPPVSSDARVEAPLHATRVTVQVEPGMVSEVDAILRRHASADPEHREYEFIAGGWDHFDPHLPPDMRSPIARSRRTA
jgi:hypothetical protein